MFGLSQTSPDFNFFNFLWGDDGDDARAGDDDDADATPSLVKIAMTTVTRSTTSTKEEKKIKNELFLNLPTNSQKILEIKRDFFF